VIDGDTDVSIEDVSMMQTSDERECMSTTLDDADMEFTGSFTVVFEDRVDALRFLSWLRGSPRPAVDDASDG
jgi:hypothetical protein